MGSGTSILLILSTKSQCEEAGLGIRVCEHLQPINGPCSWYDEGMSCKCRRTLAHVSVLADLLLPPRSGRSRVAVYRAMMANVLHVQFSLGLEKTADG